MRIGSGYDVHRLVAGRALILGGVTIDYQRGLLGHSDADVLTHAIIDALLGAAALGDIGKHFPNDDARYKDIASIDLLEEVVYKIRRQGLIIGNVDATIVCQAPKLQPYLGQMIKVIAKALQVKPHQVNIKATTTEGLGFEGRGEGISAQAVVLVDSDIAITP